MDDKKPFPPAWRASAFLGGVALLAAVAVVVPGRPPTSRFVGGSGASGSAVGVAPGASSGPRSDHRASSSTPKEGISCAAGRNGGATDVGVTATTIQLGATVVDSGVGASFLRDARDAILAVKNRVNQEGGVCGRTLNIKLIDDGWDYQRGGQFLQNLVEGDRVFALAVVPSSEGLENVARSGFLDRAGVPVVGTDGMLIGQYAEPWVWPVAASTISTMHSMAAHASKVFKSKNFALVYEYTYHFGIEGAYAFNQAVKRLTGSDIPGYSNPLSSPKCSARFCGIDATETDYGKAAAEIGDGCQKEPKCDFVAYLLEPATALKWLSQGGISPQSALHSGGAQPLFNRNFAEQCGSLCDGLWLWTGYDPPLGSYLARPEMKQYVADLKAISSTVDYTNTFVEGSYIGMQLLVAALKEVGPNLTRERLREVLDSMTFESGLAGPLRWRPGHHFANVRLRAFSIQYKDRFAGWRDELTTMNDPWVGQDIPPQS